MCYFVALTLAFLVSLSVAYIGLDRDRVLYPTVIAVVVSYYCLFALLAATVQTLIIESSVLCVLLIATILDFNRSLRRVVAALIARGFFDFVHKHIASNPWVPLWWSSFCTIYDFSAAACLAVILWQCSRSPQAIHPIRAWPIKLASPKALAIK